ncbi:MAG: AAA family ATPase [Candidatus Bathyarchaeota archaeon]|nr:AAA family ATPase [Candidatus Bathyarchaeota archaeon]
MGKAIPTGCSALDERLGGGMRGGSLTLVYGEAETGKTTLALQSSVNCARMAYKTIFIDCDGSFSPRRMEQIAPQDFQNLAKQIVLMKPQNFKEQAFVIERVRDYTSKKVGLIVVDTITGLYREDLEDAKKTFAANRELNRQMACLAQLLRTERIAGLVTSQVQSVVSGIGDTVRPVATRVLKFWADSVIKLKPTLEPNIVKALMETKTSRGRALVTFLRIGMEGLQNHQT